MTTATFHGIMNEAKNMMIIDIHRRWRRVSLSRSR